MSVSMSRIAVVLIFLTLIGNSCIGFAALPGPTQQDIQISDIAGMWRYYADFGETEIILDLKEDGTFIQTIEQDGKDTSQVHTGQWSLEGAWLKISVLKPRLDNSSASWIEEEANWWVIESYKGGTEFAVFGAAEDSDPDNCYEFERIQ